MRPLYRWTALVLLLAFVGYFGIWGLYRAVAVDAGMVWGLVAAILAGLGFVIIAVAGAVGIRSRPQAGAEPLIRKKGNAADRKPPFLQ